MFCNVIDNGAEQIRMITIRNTKLRIQSPPLRGPIMLAALSASGALSPVLAQDDSGTVTVDVARCLELESVEARLACFGAEVDEVLEERAPTVSEEQSQTSAGDTAVDETAIIERLSAERDRAPAVQQEPELSRSERRALREAEQNAARVDQDSTPEPGEFFGTIVELRERLPNAYVIRLDNGQIWEQTEPKRYALRPGLEVRIYPTRWGSRYRLTGIESGGHIQVRRVE